MMKKYLILVLVGLLAIACQKSEIQPDPSTTPPGELIEVALDLQLDASQSISRAQAQPTTCNQGAVEAELSATPIQTSTSKAVDETTVANVWVFQFDGTEASSKLIYATYIEDYVAGATIPLLKATTANRMAVVANTFDAAWGSAFAVGTATWATVSAASQTITAQSDLLRTYGGADYVPMSGSNIGTILVGSKLSVSLIRTVVKVTVNIRLGADLKDPNMSVRLCNVPNATSWFPDMGTGVWPASPTLFNYSEQELTGMNTEYKTLTYWVPINRRGTVAGVTGINRVKRAPIGATFLQAVSGLITYTIHLGADFAADYNLKGNMAYSYHLTLKSDPWGLDSRVSDGRDFGELVLSPAGIVANTGGRVTITSPKAAQGLVWSGSTYPSAGFDVGAATGVGPNTSVPVTVSVNPTNATRFSFFTAMETNGKENRITITQAASALSATVPGEISMPQGGAAIAITIKGTPGLTYGVTKKSGADAINLDEASATGTIPASGSANVLVVVGAQVNDGPARQALFTVRCTNAGTNFPETDHTVVQKAPPAKGELGYITKGVALDGIDVPAGLMYIGQYGGHDGTSYTKGLYIDKRGVVASGVNDGGPVDPQLQWKTEDTQTAGTESNTNGLANTGAILAVDPAAHPAANYCRNKGAGWYLPARDQLELGVRAAYLAGLLNGGYTFVASQYWSSSRHIFSNDSSGRDIAVLILIEGSMTGSDQALPTAVGISTRCVQEF